MKSNVTVNIGIEKYKTEVLIGAHSLLIDEPVLMGGKDLGPTPIDLLLSSLGTCKAITMRMYADQKNWPLNSIEIALEAEVLKSENGQLTQINVQVKFNGDLDEKQKERILRVGEKCPVHKILNNPIQIETNLI